MTIPTLAPELREKIEAAAAAFEIGNRSSPQIGAILAAAARLLLALHPADDGEPVTVEWCDANGFVNPWRNEHEIKSKMRHLEGVNAFVSVLFRHGEAHANVCTDARGQASINTPTRGQLRALCAALGILLPRPGGEGG